MKRNEGKQRAIDDVGVCVLFICEGIKAFRLLLTREECGRRRRTIGRPQTPYGGGGECGVRHTRK